MAAVDNYTLQSNSGKSQFSSAVKAVAVVPNDVDELAEVSRALFVGTSGNIAVVLRDDTESIIFTNVLSGSILPLRAKKILVTGTTATNIISLT